MEKLSPVCLGLKSGIYPLLIWTDPFFYSLPVALNSKSTDIMYLNLSFDYLSSNSVVPCCTFMHSYATLVPLLLLL